MKQLLISLLLLAGLSACGGEKDKTPAVPATAEAAAVHADSLPQENPAVAAELSADMQRHVHEIDSLLEGI